MKFVVKKSILVICSGLFFSITAKGADLVAGNRAYSQAKRLVWEQSHGIQKTLGAGTIVETFSDGSARFKTDESPGEIVDLDKGEVAALMTSVRCPYLNRRVYSDARYDAHKGNGVYVKQDVGFGAVQESFGDCSSGVSIFKSDTAGAPNVISANSIKSKVQCDYLNKRVYSTQRYTSYTVSFGWTERVRGHGVAIETYGDCSSGIVVFRADKNPDTYVLVDPSSFTKEVNTSIAPEQAAPARGKR